MLRVVAAVMAVGISLAIVAHSIRSYRRGHLGRTRFLLIMLGTVGLGVTTVLLGVWMLAITFDVFPAVVAVRVPFDLLALVFVAWICFLWLGAQLHATLTENREK